MISGNCLKVIARYGSKSCGEKKTESHPKEDSTLRCVVVKFHKDRVLNKEMHRDFKMAI